MADLSILKKGKKDILKKKINASGRITRFQKKVYLACLKIPEGKVASYKDIAHALGVNAYRAVGQALNKNPFAPDVPCHRVVASDGGIGGFSSGLQAKIRLLKEEGIRVRDGLILDFHLKRHNKF